MAFDGHYLDWNQKRIKGIIDFYGYKFMYLKKILDLGCGYADISGVLHRLGADVTAVDSRDEHLKIVTKKFSGIKTIKADLDRDWPLPNQKFDLILDLGLLCHLSNYEAHLRAICAHTTHLVLETAVCDSDDPALSLSVNESNGVYDLSVNGLGCRPTAAAIERVLTACGMNFKRLDDPKFNASGYIYDWASQNSKNADIHKRRIWFAIKNSSPIQFRPEQVIPQQPAHKNRTPAIQVPNAAPRAQYKVPPPVPVPQPNYPPPPQPNYLTLVPNSGVIKTRLFYNYYADSNPSRKQEIDLCLQKNIDNTKFDMIVLDSTQRPTFDFFFQKINQLAGPNDISIICNSDIFFDNSISAISGLKHNVVYALSHWDWHSNGTFNLFEKADSQDVWIIRGKVPSVIGNFSIGLPGSCGKIAFEFQKAGYKITNPCHSIKTYHVHDTGIRNYSASDELPGPYLDVEPANL